MSVRVVMTVGFFGKVRSHGDFVSRRLPPEMVLPFDAWIQAWLVQSQRELGAAWVATWSTSPIWRFVLAPGLCGPQAWTGVMMPSLDRVGRCFPLILAASLQQVPSLRACLCVHTTWYLQLEELALSSLDDEFSIERFDADLTALRGGPVPAESAGSVARQSRPIVCTLSCANLPQLADVAMVGHSAWWSSGSPDIAPCLALCSGLPALSFVTALVDGRWLARGWRSDRSDIADF